MNSYIKLVIADDEPNIRDSLSQLFPWEELGIQVVFLAANGREVLDYMEMNPVDLLLADIRMPVMDGLELTQAVRQAYPEVPVILLSVCVAVCILDITLPMMFRFGVEKGRLAMFLIIFLVCASAGGIATIEQSSLDGGFYLSLSLVPAAIAAVVLTVVSIPLAIRFYGRRSR